MRTGKRELLDYLQDILYAIDRAESFVADMDYAAFEADEKTNFAAVRALEILGEASKKIPPDIRREYPDIPWKEMAGMRDKLSHDYLGVNLRGVMEERGRECDACGPEFWDYAAEVMRSFLDELVEARLKVG